MKNSFSWTWQVGAGGGINPKVAQQLVEALRNMGGKSVRLTIEEHTIPATTAQKAYYRGVVLKLIHAHCMRSGAYMAGDDAHDVLRKIAGLFEVDVETGEQVLISTRVMDTKQMAHLIDTSVMWAAENLGLNIPEPIADINQYRDYMRD